MRISSGKLPLYVGLSVFIVSVLISTVVLGEQVFVGRKLVEAEEESSEIALVYTPPNLVGVVMTSNSEVYSIGFTLRFDPEKFFIDQSTFYPNPAFSLYYKIVDNEKGIARLRLTVKKKGVKSAVVASFAVQPVNYKGPFSSTISLLESSEDSTFVISKETDKNILTSTEGVELSF